MFLYHFESILRKFKFQRLYLFINFIVPVFVAVRFLDELVEYMSQIPMFQLKNSYFYAHFIFLFSSRV